LKIQLLLPAGDVHRHRTGIFKRSLRYAPLTLTTLAALVPDELEPDVTIQDEGTAALDLDFDADIVGISAITGTALRAYAVADELRARGHTVVLGGVHPTLLPEEAAAHADCVVTGHAEETWPALLRDFANRRLQPRYAAGPPGRVLHVPRPRRDLLDPRRYATTQSIEATRGCPHSCDFCAVPAAWPGQYGHRPVEDVIAELASFEKRHALFVDLSPVEDTQYAAALYRAMIPLRMRWVGLATTRIAADRKLLDLAARSGCIGLLIGFESISQATLNGTSKHFHTAGTYSDAITALHDRGIAVQGCFVFGFEEDDESVFERTVEFADRACIDLPRYAAMTPFPGTAAYRRLAAEGRLLHRDWSLYDVEHVVFQPRRMSPERLQEGLNQAWRESYRWGSIGRRIAGSRCSIPLSISLNLGYRYFARKLPGRTREVQRDPTMAPTSRDAPPLAAVAHARNGASPSRAALRAPTGQESAPR
jgi:radical SAM superfamily enzyme YgiQ (UPF0313 family)